MQHLHNRESSQIQPSVAASNFSTQTTTAQSCSSLASREADTKVHSPTLQRPPQCTENDENSRCQFPITFPGGNCGRRHSANQISNNSRLQLPTNVIGANKLPDLSAAIQLTRGRALARFESIEPLPNFTVAVRIIVAIVDACFIDINDLLG